ncbi:MAG: hypothetical protein SV062_00890 [Thermodesulfobacteriota bacterium]|nr:hypothetical protein [Thermodesulfobacteriota bacterium]
MSWVISSLLCGFFLAATDAVSKVAVRTSSEYLIAWVRFFYAVPFLIIFLPFIEIPNLDPTFFFVSFLLIPLEITALILYVKAIKISLLSVTIPFLGLTPVFLTQVHEKRQKKGKNSANQKQRIL